MNGIPTFIEQALTQPTQPQVEKTETTSEKAVNTKVDAVEVKTETATETAKTETKVETPVFDFKIIDERLTSPDDIKKFLSERDTYFSELEDTKNKLSQFDGYIKPADAEISKLNEIKANGGNVDLFLQMRKIDPQSLKGDEAVKLLMQFQDGLTSQSADRKVRILYKTDENIEQIQADIKKFEDSSDAENYNPKEAQRLKRELEGIYLAQDELTVAGKKAIQALSELKVKSQDVPNIQKIQDEVRTSWQPHVGKFIPKDLSIPFKIENPDKTQSELNVKFTLDGEAQKDINEFLQGTVEYFASQGIPYDEDKAMKMLTEEVKYKVLGKNFDKISDMKVQAALEAERKRVKDAIHATPKTEEKVETKKEENEAAKHFFNIVKGHQIGARI